MLCYYSVLQSSYFSKPFSVATDAGDDATGAVLLQHDERDNVEHLVA